LLPILHCEAEAEAPKRRCDVIDDLGVRVADPEDSVRAAALRVEDAGEIPASPLVRRCSGPADHLLDGDDRISSRCADRSQRLMAAGCLLEREFGGPDAFVGEISAGPL